MPLAKESPQIEVSQEITDHPQAKDVITFEGVPLDFYSYFSAQIDTTIPAERDKLRDIYEYVKGEGKSLGDMMTDVSNIEDKLGLGGGEKRIDRVWNWVRMSKHIQDLEARRKSLEKRS